VLQKLPRTSILLLVLIGAIAIGLSIASYQYSSIISQETRKIAAQYIRSNAEIEAHDIANNLKNKIGAVRSNLALLSTIPAIQNQNIETSKNLFSDAQESTSDITSSYFWVGKDGKLIWANAFENQTIYKQYSGDDRSFRPYFSQPRATLKPYLSTVIESVDAVPRLFIAEPIILNSSENNNGNNNNPIFNGVVVSAIDVNVLGQFLQSQLSTNFESTFGMVDRNGTILYSADSKYIGKNIFGDEFQVIIPAEIRNSFNSFVRDSLSGSAGAGEITYQGNTSTIAYQPVSFSGEQFTVAYIIAPHKLQETVAPLIDQQRNFNLTMMVAIGGVAVAIAILIIRWTTRFDKARDEIENMKQYMDLVFQELKGKKDSR
jgi:C4-dicarboxylate-specific signal transduction histidine kinase